jgi:hypothetical protein
MHQDLILLRPSTEGDDLKSFLSVVRFYEQHRRFRFSPLSF